MATSLYKEVRPVTDVTALEEGDHIRVPREVVGFKIYYHHMLVVERYDARNEQLKVIHFTWADEVAEKLVRIKEETIEFQIKEGDTVELLVYQDSPSGERIVKEAREIMKEEPRFNLLEYNCEHFVNDAVTGHARSDQVKALARAFESIIGGAKKGRDEGKALGEVFEEAGEKVILHLKRHFMPE